MGARTARFLYSIGLFKRIGAVLLVGLSLGRGARGGSMKHFLRSDILRPPEESVPSRNR